MSFFNPIDSLRSAANYIDQQKSCPSKGKAIVQVALAALASLLGCLIFTPALFRYLIDRITLPKTVSANEEAISQAAATTLQ